MNRILILSGMFGALAFGGITSTGWAATPVAGFVGSAPSSVAGCTYITWRLARHGTAR